MKDRDLSVAIQRLVRLSPQCSQFSAQIEEMALPGESLRGMFA
jgi:hypothetical protein